MKETLRQLLRQQPFQPFTIEMSNGKSFEVRHPEMAMLLKSNVIIGSPDADNYEICSLLHIANARTDGPLPS